MEKRRAHYDLKAIQNQMSCLDGVNLTESARHGIKSAGMNMDDVLEVNKGLNISIFISR